MIKARDCLATGFIFKFGNGNSSFWNDSWLTASALGPQVPFVHIHDIDLRLKDVYVGGAWNLDMLHTVIPQEWRDKILSMRPTLVPSVADAWTWSDTYTGIYSVKSAYKMLLEGNRSDESSRNWSWLWKMKIPANVQFFLWQFCHASLPTRSVLRRRNVLATATCAACNTHDETLHHCLFECPRAQEVWKICVTTGFAAPSSDFIPSIWLHDSVHNTGTFFTVIMWKIWCARNLLVFEDKNIRPSEVAAQAYGLWHDVLSAFGPTVASTARISSGLEVSWQAPPGDWVALNVDGSAQVNPPSAAFGGLVRDTYGKFLRGFYGSLGNSSIMYAELRALLHGLEMCWAMGFKKILCYSDSINTLKLIEQAQVLYHTHGNEVALARDLLSRPWEVRIQHVYREANFCADYLAKLGLSGSQPHVIVETPPAALTPLLQANA